LLSIAQSLRRNIPIVFIASSNVCGSGKFVFVPFIVQLGFNYLCPAQKNENEKNEKNEKNKKVEKKMCTYE
jgi:hypothetical protein